MQNASTYKPKQSFTLLIQGPPKSRKTSLALSFPRPYVADLDNNMGGTLRWMKSQGMKTDHIFYDIPDIIVDPETGVVTERPYKDRYTFLTSCLKEAAASPDIDTIVIDGWTKLNSYIIGDIGRQKPTIGEKNPKPRREGQMSLEDWNDHLYMCQNFVTKLQATSKMVIFTAHEEASDRTDIPGVLIALQGKKAQATVPGMFSDVWRTEITEQLKASGGREYLWKIRTQATGSYQLGCSLGLPDLFVMDWPTIQKALDKGFGTEVKK